MRFVSGESRRNEVCSSGTIMSLRARADEAKEANFQVSRRPFVADLLDFVFTRPAKELVAKLINKFFNFFYALFYFSASFGSRHKVSFFRYSYYFTDDQKKKKFYSNREVESEQRHFNHKKFFYS